MKYTIPGAEDIEITAIVIDFNGTLAVRGEVVQGAAEKINQMKQLGFRIILVTSDQRGNAKAAAAKLGIEFVEAKDAGAKEKFMLTLDSGKVAAIGNARIDTGLYKKAKIRVATLQAEGIHTGILPFVDMIVPSVIDALDLFMDADTFVATMKK
jgi:soluble P-type ATPase